MRPSRPTVSSGSGRDAVDLELEAPMGSAEEAIGAMHLSFAEYAEKGAPSGALLETAESLRGEMAGGTRVAIARFGGDAVAVAKHRPLPDGTLHFSRLGVVPRARSRGLASTIVRALRTRAHDEGLRGLSCAVRADERGNIALYERLGMVVAGRERRMSRTGAMFDVVSMRDAAVRE